MLRAITRYGLLVGIVEVAVAGMSRQVQWIGNPRCAMSVAEQDSF